MESFEDTRNPKLKSYFRRKIRQIPVWSLILLSGIVILLVLVGSDTTQYYNYSEGIESDNPLEVLVLNEIRKHLFQYNPSLPTNISDGKKNVKHIMANIIANHLNYKRNGFFVECGAVDGVFLSNTLLLERDYNWTGLLVEADPKYVPVLIDRNRKAVVANVCLSPKSVPIQLDMTGHEKVPGLGFIENQVLGKGRWQADMDRHFRAQCFPLAMLLDALGRTDVDYLSLDVEGLELDILKTIPFDRIRIQLMSLEVREKDREGIQNFLKPLGYTRFKRIEDPSVYLIDDLYEFTG